MQESPIVGQAKLFSIIQDESHPSPEKLFPSSHSSEECFKPSPHLTSHASFAAFGDSPLIHWVQESGLETVPDVQIYPSSIVHDEEHPSVLPELKSSHSSEACFSPSPQVVSHTSFAMFGEVAGSHSVQVSSPKILPPVHIKLLSIVQAELHPSLSALLSSSHSSVGCLSPSPHLMSQTVLPGLGEVPPVHSLQLSLAVIEPPFQMCMLSIVQEELHPSLSVRLSSSQSSEECLRPSPQTILLLRVIWTMC